jgi:hypothetical protein
MDWIKKNPDQFALGLLAFLLLACSGWIIFRSLHFADTFSATAVAPPRKDTVPPVDIASINEAQQEVEKPAQWVPKAPANAREAGSLFVSDQYIVDNGQLKKVTGASLLGQTQIPVAWKRKYNINILDVRAEDEDPDKDGFSNKQEYWGVNRKGDGNPEGDADSTNPLDAKSHPPYYAVLWLKQWVQQNFQFVMKAWAGNAKDPASLDFQINAGLNTPTQFLKIGDMVAGTKYKLDHFEEKSQVNQATNATDDVSELTLINIETNDPVVLVKNRSTTSPDTRGIFQYRWGPNPQDFQVQRLQEFALRPNTSEKYKLIDIKETEAVIQLPTGEKVTIPKGQ